MVFLLTALVSCALALNSELVELDCPVDCECHYFRVNWVTDCSESNLTAIPYDELSQDVYILDMNGNNVEEVKRFPDNIKLRRLQMAHNKLTHLGDDSFKGLNHLLEADFSSNAITKVDPDTFKDSTGLITLELQNNPLAPVQGHLLNCRMLKSLDLSSCSIKKLSNEFFHNTTSLNELDLSYNPLGRIETGPFDILTPRHFHSVL